MMLALCFFNMIQRLYPYFVQGKIYHGIPHETPGSVETKVIV